ncbi:hypothetical protein ACA910_017697 [Epithemia clementina (nom. ined.)]
MNPPRHRKRRAQPMPSSSSSSLLMKTLNNFLSSSSSSSTSTSASMQVPTVLKEKKTAIATVTSKTTIKQLGKKKQHTVTSTQNNKKAKLVAASDASFRQTKLSAFITKPVTLKHTPVPSLETLSSKDEGFVSFFQATTPTSSSITQAEKQQSSKSTDNKSLSMTAKDATTMIPKEKSRATDTSQTTRLTRAPDVLADTTGVLLRTASGGDDTATQLVGNKRKKTKISVQMMEHFKPHLVTQTFQPSTPASAAAASTTKGILQWLDHRACLGPQRIHSRSSSNTNTNNSTASFYSPPVRMPPWKFVPWLELNTGSSIRQAQQQPIRHVQWDHEGVLLAVLIGSRLAIYDWDSVIASDRQGRNLCARRQGQDQQREEQENQCDRGQTQETVSNPNNREQRATDENNHEVDQRKRETSNASVGLEDYESSRHSSNDLPVTQLKKEDEEEEPTSNARTKSSTRRRRGRPAVGSFQISPTIVVPLHIPSGSSSSSSSSSSSLGYLSLHWNVYNPDVVALLHLDGHVLIFDLGLVVAWQEERDPRQEQQQHASWSNNDSNRRGPPVQSVLLDSTMCRCGSRTGHLLFVSPIYLLVSMGEHLACYVVRPLPTKPKLLWKWRWSHQPISSMTTLGVPCSQNCVVLGSQHGHLALIDWKHVQQAAFSVHPMPTILGQWSTLTSFQHPKSVGAMGIVHLVVSPSTGGNLLNLSWHTPCGWAIKMCLDRTNQQFCVVDQDHENKGILYSTPKIVSYNDRGEVTAGTAARGNQWSLPASGSVTGTGTAQSLLWTRVAAVSQFLPPHDQRVLASSSCLQQQRQLPTIQMTPQRLVRDDDNNLHPTLLHCHRTTGNIQSIPLGTNNNNNKSLQAQRWTASALALHPSDEWIVVATAGGGLTGANGLLRIYNARNRS